MALIVGNSAYSTAPLKNPANDARLMAQTLRGVGFEVLEYRDTDRRELTKAFYEFGRRLKESGEDTVALIYYAGHAAQVRGENYLIPVGAKLEEELDIEIESVRASSLLRILSDAGNALNIVVLDACRNNPFARGSRTVERGLARMDAPTGTLLAYSTAPGRVAVDGTGSNSPYTRALAKNIQKPGLKVEDVFKQVRVEVMERTGRDQVPWESSSLIGDFYFHAPQDAEPVPAPVAAPENSTVAPVDGLAIEVEYWKSLASSNDRSAFQAYLERFPDGVFADLAQQRIAILDKEQERQARDRERKEEQLLWDNVKNSGDPVLLQSFLNKYPAGLFRELAEAKLSALTAKPTTTTTTTTAETEPARPTNDSTSPAIRFDFTSPTRPQAAETTTANDTPKAAQQQTASVSAAVTEAPPPPTPKPVAKPEPVDLSGTWKIEWEVIGGFIKGPFCAKSERGTKKFTVEDGEFSFHIQSNRGGSAYVSGTLNNDGILQGEFKATLWRRAHRFFASGVKSGTTGTTGGSRCTGLYTLTYLGKSESDSGSASGAPVSGAPTATFDR